MSGNADPLICHVTGEGLTFGPVAPPLSSTLWQCLAQVVPAAAAHAEGRMGLAEIGELVAPADGSQPKASLWVARSSKIVHAACLVQIGEERHDTATRPVIRVWLLGALDYALFPTLLGAVETWGAAEGCTAFEVEGRPGWEAVLAASGWTRKAVTLAKDLDGDALPVADDEADELERSPGLAPVRFMPASAPEAATAPTFGMVAAPFTDALWSAAAALLEPAMVWSGEITADALRTALDDGDCQLWVSRSGELIHMALVTELVTEGSGKKTCNVWLIGGNDRSLWLHHLPTVEAWAHAEGCHTIDVAGRPGWARLLKPYGYEVVCLLPRTAGGVVNHPAGLFARAGSAILFKRLQAGPALANKARRQAEPFDWNDPTQRAFLNPDADKLKGAAA